jgi:DNA-binding beta-propeller fold protein YncE
LAVGPAPQQLGRGTELSDAAHLANRPRTTLVALAAALLTFVVLALGALSFASTASATLYVGSFFGNPTNATGNTGGLFNQPRGVAVNNATGHVYVADQSNQRIHELDASGTFVRAWGRDVIITLRANDGGTAASEVCDTTAAAPNFAADCKAGSNAGTIGGQFNTPQGVAVNQATGHVYVTDGGRLRVQEFTASGAFVRAWGRDVILAGRPNDISATAFEVCDTTAAAPNVAADCKTGVAGSTGGAFAPTFDGYLAVAPAGAPNAGNVLVADPGNRRVQEFTAGGGFVRAFGADVDAPAGGTAFEVCTVEANCQAGPAGDGVPVGQFATNFPKRLAVDGTGAVYTVEAGGITRRMQRFSPGGPLGLMPEQFADTIVGTSGGNLTEVVDVTVNPANDHVYVARLVGTPGSTNGRLTCPDGSLSVDVEVRVLELSAAGALLDTHLSCAGFSGTGAAGIRGLALRPGSGPADSDRLYASSNYPGPAGGTTHRVYVLDDDGITAALSAIEPAADVTDSTASLSGSVNPNSVDNSFAPTRWRLEYSPNGVDWSTAASGSLPAGTSAVQVSGTAADLLPNTLYRTRVVTAKPFANPEVSSAELTFLTDAVKPGVTAVHADSVSDTSARLTGQVIPHSTPTRYRFEWGRTGFGNVVPIPDGLVGAGPTAVFVAEQLSGLEPGTTYQFRLVATSDTEGATTSDVKTFTTSSVPGDGRARAYELVSPVDKVGGTGVGEWYQGPASMAGSGVPARTGDRFAAAGDFGSTLMDGAQAWANDWAFADRVSDAAGWRSHAPLTHPHHRAVLAGKIALASTVADLSRSYWISPQGTPSMFPELIGDWATVGAGMMSDWGTPPSPTRWELFGPRDTSELVLAGNAADLWGTAFSADGSRLLGLTVPVGTSGLVRGLAGPGDPTDEAWGSPSGELVSGRSIYMADVSGQLADNFAGTGPRTLVNVCTGTGGADRTQVPAVDSDGNMTAADCAATLPGRDARLVSDRGATFVKGDTNLTAAPVEDVVSRDGKRVFFMSPDPVATGVPDGSTTFCTTSGSTCPPQLYMRQENPDGSVVMRWISRADDELLGVQDASLTGAAFFEGATPDGDKVFFRTNSPLTADDPNGAGTPPPPGGVTTGSASTSSWDLYMYDLPDAPSADPGEGRLTRISAGPTGDADCNSPVGGAADVSALRFASDDGSRVYFTCGAPLAGVGGTSDGAVTTPAGTIATLDATNLYAYDGTLAQADRWRFVARLQRSTTDPLAGCASTGVLPRSPLAVRSQGKDIVLPPANANPNCMNGAADGGFVTFMSMARLTPDDPVGQLTGDVYGYDLASGDLTRLSASRGGPGGTYACAPGNSAAVCVADPGIGTQPSTSIGTGSAALSVVTDPLAPNDRIAFFQSKARLLPEDTDGAYDVYEWRSGRLSLVTTGKSPTDGAIYKGTDATGRNAYFVTRDRLTWQDRDSVADIYVARIGGGIAQPPAPVLCDALAGGCQGSPTVAAPTSVESKGGGGGDASPGLRARVRLARLSSKDRSALARGGRVKLTVSVSQPGTVTVTGTSRLGKKLRRVAVSSRTASTRGRLAVPIGLSKAARRELAKTGRLTVSLTVSFSNARVPARSSITLERAKAKRKKSTRKGR